MLIWYMGFKLEDNCCDLFSSNLFWCYFLLRGVVHEVGVWVVLKEDSFPYKLLYFCR